MHKLVAFALAFTPALCAKPQAGPSAGGAATGDFERNVVPFVVQDASGAAYAQPFLGGFDVPRPHFLDIDADGDLDLFVQERSNQLMFFENTGNAQSATFVWRTDKFEGLDVGEWTRFVDIDRDGDYDLLAEETYSHIRLYRNRGTKARAAYVLATDSLRDDRGAAIFADRQNIPNIIDIDCDNLLDLFLGRVEGTVTRYEEVAGSRTLPDGPRFQFVTDRWEDIEIVAQLPGSMHGANTMYFADTDEDGDLDFYWGDFFEDGVLTITNQGSCAAPQFRSTPAPIVLGGEKLSTSGYNVPVLVDLDGDRDLDLLVGVLGGAYNPNRTAADNFYFLERRDQDYLLRSRRFLATIDIGSETRPAVGDLDGDGDADLLVGNKLDPADQSGSRLYLFRNLGSRTQPAFRLADTLDLVKSFHYAPALADLDGDRDLDLLLGTWNQGVLVYRNTGASQGSQWQQDSTATIVLTRGSHATPAVGDVDGDGDLDLFVGEASGELNFFRNTGTARAFRFELVSDAFESIDVGQRSHPALHDYDGDGDLDLVVGQEQGGISFFRNSGTRTEPKFAADSTVKLALPGLSAPIFADVNGDGHAELIAGGISGGLWYFQPARAAK